MRTLVIAIVCWAGVAAADDQIHTTAVDTDKLPNGVTMHGDELVTSLQFVDKNGTNYVLFSTTKTTKQAPDGQAPEMSTWLYVDDWVVPKQGAPRNLLPVRDMVASCVMGDPRAAFHQSSIGVTDLDHDGLAELTFGYQLANCRSDVRPSTYKLLVLENGTKYILRGETLIGGGGDRPGGTFVADPAESKWPGRFLEHAKQVWAETDRELSDH